MLKFALLVALTLASLRADNPFDHVVPLAQVGDRMPAARFVDQQGSSVTFDDLRGDATAVAFVYTRCRDACPVITRKFGQVRASLGDSPTRLIEVTIDPSHDTHTVIAAYAREYGIRAPAWLVLTGVPAAVDDFNRRMGVQAIQSGREEIIHNDRVVLVAPDGTIADIIEGASWTPADLAAELRHMSGERSSWLNRVDLAVGAAVAFCGGALSGRAGIGDLLVSFAVFAVAIWLFVWLIRRSSAARA
jgi:cytochrome oxidase Cu insertion factor (SCO1/SenC/PrrC family)